MSAPLIRVHKEYQESIKKELAFRRIEIPLIFQDIFIKLYEIDISPVSFIVKDRYSHKGTPARDPQDMLRSLLAMTLLGSFPSLAILSRFLPENTPGVGTFYDFLDRLYLMEKSASKPKGKPKSERKPRGNKKTKNESLSETSPEHTHKGVIQRLVDRMIKEDIRRRASPNLEVLRFF